MTIELGGKVTDESGDPLVGLTVELWTSAAWESPGSRTASTTTDSDGLWAFDSQAADTTKWIVVVIDSNGNKYLIDGRNEIQLTELDLVTKLQADTINEHTSATGVTIDGLLIKDNHIQFPEATNPAGSIVYGSRDNTGDLTLNALSGKAINLAINGSDEITVTSAGLNLPANSDINFTGTTGTNDIKLTDSLADALSITRGGTDMVLFDSSTPRITFTPVTTFTGTITGPSGTWDSGGVDIAASDSYAVNGQAILSDSSGTMTLSNVDAIDATTEATIEGAIDTLSNLVTTGALGSGSITSGFGTIDTGSSAITTTGLISGGSLDIDNVLINGTTIGHTDDTDLLTLASGLVTVAGEISTTTLDIGGTNVTSTAAELNILDGVTSTAAELNILDGVTSTAAELNILDGVTSTAAELNIVDGVTSTAAELNLVDGSSANSVVNSKAVIYGSSGELAGTLSTAAQGNITSVGTLSSPTLTTPTISSTGFTNATHAHTAANSGGVLTYGRKVFIPVGAWHADASVTVTTYGEYQMYRFDDGDDDLARVNGFFELTPTAVKIVCINVQGDSRDLAYYAITDFAAAGELGDIHEDTLGSGSSPLTVTLTGAAPYGAVNTLDIIDVFTGAQAGDYFGLTFHRDGADAADTIGAYWPLLGLLIEY